MNATEDFTDSQCPSYTAGRAEALRQLAADLEDEARSITGQDEPPWAAMYGLKVTSGAEAAVILRRAAELALRRADAAPDVPGRALPRTRSSRVPAGNPDVRGPALAAQSRDRAADPAVPP